MKTMGTVLGIALVCLLLLVAAIYLRQEVMLYFPARTTAERVVNGELRAWPSPDDFRGLVAEPRAPVHLHSCVTRAPPHGGLTTVARRLE